jgi:peptidoglycan/xylan/chitin deacetylase (PgdA/CDA1 family)
MNKRAVFFCFDTEDPANPEADAPIRRLCEIFDRAGAQANFFIVAEKARLLRQRNRRDVLDALRSHEVDYHGNYWFEFPEQALVYGERDPYDTALAKALAYEVRGLNDLAEITGQFPVAFCQHQNNYSVATTDALRRAGVRVWNGGFGPETPRPGTGWLMDMLFVGRHGSPVVSAEGGWHGRFQVHPDQAHAMPEPMSSAEEFRRFQERFDAALTVPSTHINIVGHPTNWAMAEWWGWHEWSLPIQVHSHNSLGTPGPYPHGRAWQRGVLRSPADSEAHYAWTERAVQWLCQRDDVELLTFGAYLAQQEQRHGVWLNEAEVRRVAGHCRQHSAALPMETTTLSPADMLVVLARYVQTWFETHSRPQSVQVQRVLGPMEPILSPGKPLAFKRDDLFLAARLIAHGADAHGRLPAALRAHFVDCGPAEALRALAEAVSAESETCPDVIAVPPLPPLPDIAAHPFFAHAAPASTHAPPGFATPRIAQQCSQQSWSYAPCHSRTNAPL